MSIRRLYSNGTLESDDLKAVDLARRLAQADDGSFAWIDLCSTDTQELGELAEVLDLHDLAVEDAVDDQERQKLFRFPGHRSMQVVYLALEDGDEPRLALTRVTAFVTRSVVLTVHDGTFPVEDMVQRLDDNADLAAYGIDFLVWGLVDVIVDANREVLNRLDDRAEDLGREAFTARDFVDLQTRVFALRRLIARVRRSAIPLRDVVAGWYHQELSEQGLHRLEPYFQDVLDHATFSVEAADSTRELADTISESVIGLQGNAANDIMKQVTSWAAIIGVPAVIVGFFGENVNFPGYGTDWGTWFSLGLIFIACTILYVLFRRSNWL